MVYLLTDPKATLHTYSYVCVGVCACTCRHKFMINKNKFLLVCVLEEIRLRECWESARKKRNHNKYVKQPKSMQINAVIARTWLGFYAATCAHVGRPLPTLPQERNNRQFAKAPRKHHPFHSLAACPVSVSVSISFQLRACWYLGPFGPMVLWSLGPLVALVERLVASVWATLFALCGYGKLIFMRSIYVFLLHTHSLPCVCVCVCYRHAPITILKLCCAARQQSFHHSHSLSLATVRSRKQTLQIN